MLYKRLLFVDNKYHALSSLQRMLQKWEPEWNMIFTASAEAAWRFLGDREFDVVVADMQMNVISGLQLLDRIRSSDHTKDIPVVMVTGSRDADLKRQAMDRGAHDLLYKPLWLEDLCARLRSLLHFKAQHDELKQMNRALEAALCERTKQLSCARTETVWRLAKAAEYRDEFTGNHVIRVGYYSQIIAEAYGLSAELADELLLAAPLHDVGKIGIPDTILHKPGPLTPDEWTIMKQHCVIGRDILEGGSKGLTAANQLDQLDKNGCQLDWGKCDNRILQKAASIALNHHEKWDGSGYPNALARYSIPVESRIVAIADSFDALTSLRPYKGPVKEDAAVAILSRDIGKHFDPRVFDAFIRSLPKIKASRHVLADDAMVGGPSCGPAERLTILPPLGVQSISEAECLIPTVDSCK